MLTTCRHMLPWCQQWWLKISQHHHVASVVTGFMAGSYVGWGLATQQPGQSMSHWAITLIIYMYINVYNTFFPTFLHQIMPLQCNFLQSFTIFLYVKKNPPTCQQHLTNMTSCVVWCVTTDRIWQLVGPTFMTCSQCVGMLAANMPYGGSGNATHCGHSQIRWEASGNSKAEGCSSYMEDGVDWLLDSKEGPHRAGPLDQEALQHLQEACCTHHSQHARLQLVQCQWDTKEVQWFC